MATWLPKDYNKELLNGSVSFDDVADYMRQIYFRICGHHRAGCSDPWTRNCTFLIPFSADSIERVSSLHLVILNILANTSSKIIIKVSDEEGGYDYDDYLFNPLITRFHRMFAAQEPNMTSLMDELQSRIKLLVEPRENGAPFHRMKHINDMIMHSDTEIIINCDSDVLISSSAIRNITQLLLSNDNLDVVYPAKYGKLGAVKRVWCRRLIEDGLFYHKRTRLLTRAELVETIDTDEAISQVHRAMSRAIAEDNFESVAEDNHKFILTMDAISGFGHMVFVRRQSYISAGGENENFISWGAEDVERYVRMVHMDFSISRVWAHVLHLEHPRGPDSGNSNPHFQGNEMLWEGLQKMSKDELLEYYKSVKYCHKYGWKI